MKAQVIGNALIVTSSVDYADFATLKELAPNMLAVAEKHDDGEIVELFRADVVKNTSKAELTQYGVVFNSKDKEGKARATITFESDAEDKKEVVLKKYARAFMYLKAIEENAKVALAQVKKDYDAVASVITVID